MIAHVTMRQKARPPDLDGTAIHKPILDYVLQSKWMNKIVAIDAFAILLLERRANIHDLFLPPS